MAKPTDTERVLKMLIEVLTMKRDTPRPPLADGPDRWIKDHHDAYCGGRREGFVEALLVIGRVLGED